MELNGKSALVIGAASPIGRAATRRLREEGAKLFEIDAWPGPSTKTAARTAAEAPFSHADHTAERHLTEFLPAEEAVDVVLFVGGTAPVRTTILDATVQDFDTAVSRDVIALFAAMRAVLPGMIERRAGRFFVSCSIAALNGVEGDVVSAGCDHAMLGLVRAAAMDVAPHGITINAICHPRISGDDGESARFAVAVADAMVFLCSSEAQSITGAQFVVDAAASARIGHPLVGQAA
jgi:ribitol 2-dehydrogenase